MMPLRERVEAVLDCIRPMIQMEGGDIELVIEVHGSDARLTLTGKCAGCPIVDPTVHTVSTAIGPPKPVSLDDRLREVEAGLIRWALTVTGGNKSKAAELLGIKRSTLGDRITRCGLASAPVSLDVPQAPISLAGDSSPSADRRS
jgi:DNA-binding NtrC family response regulator